MNASAQVCALDEILESRELFRQEMNCQILHDSIHRRPGWTIEYLLRVGDAPAGYGSVAILGPWKDRPTIYEFFVLPEYRSRAFDLFEALLEESRAAMIEVQTNDMLLTVMRQAFARDIESEKIVFQDGGTTTLSVSDVTFRQTEPDDAGRMFVHHREPEGAWVLEVDGQVAASGGIAYHYNRPYVDLYMEVAEPFRRRGLGSYLVQELKRVCREQENIPCARCSPDNLASRKTLQKAGFVPCGHLLHGTVKK